MRRYSICFATVAALLLSLLPAPASAGIAHLLPRPKSVVAGEGSLTAAGATVTIDDPTATPALERALREAGFAPAPGGDVRVEVTIGPVEGARDYELAGYPDESYRLAVRPGSISVTAASPVGVIRAAQTLSQLAEDGGGSIPAVTVTDWPAFKLRGLLHDTGRSFISVDELRREIDLLSAFKVNTFHWHLTENQAWRFEVKAFPQLTDSAAMIRDKGLYYTQEQCRDLERYAAERGVTVIPEIDMPGHSRAFVRAMGYDMQSDSGRMALRRILDEVASVFELAPYIHIGGDEISFDDSFIIDMARYVADSLGRMPVIWNMYNVPARSVDPARIPAAMVTNWATSGRLVQGIPNVDMRYNYINHFDLFADIAGIYRTTIFGEREGNPDIAGTTTAIWNDTRLRSESDIVAQNNMYAAVLASAERAWAGGGAAYIEEGGARLPDGGPEYEEFADWERRFLYHKDRRLTGEPVPYVGQSNVRWRITGQIANGGDAGASFEPERYMASAGSVPASFVIGGDTCFTATVAGAGHYLRHIWHPVVKGVYDEPRDSVTAYAWTNIYSPADCEAGALIEFYTFSRSGNEHTPEAGKWDRRGSRIWLNGEEIAAPVWEQPDADIPQDDAVKGLADENVTARRPVAIRLHRGWNRVMLKLPHNGRQGAGRDKWQFTFVVTDRDGRHALPDLVYDPDAAL